MERGVPAVLYTQCLTLQSICLYLVKIADTGPPPFGGGMVIYGYLVMSPEKPRLKYKSKYIKVL
jgi:hypothetical protein